MSAIFLELGMCVEEF